MVASPLYVNSFNVGPSIRPQFDNPEHKASWVLSQIQSGYILTIDRERRNGLIICKPSHAEFAGPGASIGGSLDLDCQKLLIIGNLSVQAPKSYEESHKAYCIRQAWNRLIQEFTQIKSPSYRAKKVLTQFELYFGKQIVAEIPDEILGLLAKVAPQIIQAKRL